MHTDAPRCHVRGSRVLLVIVTIKPVGIGAEDRFRDVEVKRKNVVVGAHGLCMSSCLCDSVVKDTHAVVDEGLGRWLCAVLVKASVNVVVSEILLVFANMLVEALVSPCSLNLARHLVLIVRSGEAANGFRLVMREG